MVVYRELLVSKNLDGQIPCPHKLVHRKRIGLLLPHDPWDGAPVPQSGTDSTLLRSCRKVYDEALPILYGENVFCFEAVRSIRYFKEKGLAISHYKSREIIEGGIIRSAEMIGDASRTQIPVFDFRPNLQGRCTMIQHLALRFFDGDEGLQAPDAFPYAYHVDDVDSWAKFIHHNKYSYGPDGICFTSLKTLKLDFSNWQLSEPNFHRALWVSPRIQH